MNVLIIPEDFRKDQYILQPIIQAMLRRLGRGKAKVRVLTDPLLGGVSEALKRERISEIIDANKYMVDLFLLCVDRDGQAGRINALDWLEKWSIEFLNERQILLGENAWQEIEVWCLAGLDLPKDWEWKQIRKEPHAKEAYYLPLAERRGLHREVAEGRKTLGQEAARRYDRIRRCCEEDVQRLEKRIANWMQ